MTVTRRITVRFFRVCRCHAAKQRSNKECSRIIHSARSYHFVIAAWITKEAESKQNMKASVIFAIAAVALTACTTGEKISQIRPGMTTGQVTAILGHPDG